MPWSETGLARLHPSKPRMSQSSQHIVMESVSRVHTNDFTAKSTSYFWQQNRSAAAGRCTRTEDLCPCKEIVRLCKNSYEMRCKTQWLCETFVRVRARNIQASRKRTEGRSPPAQLGGIRAGLQRRWLTAILNNKELLDSWSLSSDRCSLVLYRMLSTTNWLSADIRSNDDVISLTFRRLPRRPGTNHLVCESGAATRLQAWVQALFAMIFPS